MFNNNVTQTYNFQDASYEIIFMLLGAFLLGCLLTWLLNKLFNRDYSVENSHYRYNNFGSDEINTFKQIHTPQAETTGDVKIVDKPTQRHPKIVTTPDDLTKIRGIDIKMQTALSSYGIKSFTDLRDINAENLKSIQVKQKIEKREVETWPHQASLAAKGEWNKLKDYQGFIQRVQLASKKSDASKTKNYKPSVQDELTKVVGISPKIQNILNNKKIHTFKQLSHIDSEILKSHLVESDAELANHETESWPHQAAMADKEQWDELKIYQEFMHSDVEPKITNKNITDKVISEAENEDTDEKGIVKSIPKIIDKNEELNLNDHDDLKKIEGIGPKIEEVLNGGGIYTYSQLYNSNRDRLKQLLDDAGNQFRMHNPDSWPHQAGMANRAEWDELQTYKETLVQEQAYEAKQKIKKLRNVDENEKDTEVKKSGLKPEKSSDNLKKIEGIGPKIEEVLNGGGIYTYSQLYNSDRETLRELLDDAGSQFKMHNPNSWSHQSGMAHREEWDELVTYKKTLIKEQALEREKLKIEETDTGKDPEQKVSKLIPKNLKDNLQKIEGIGPKIKELLNKNGIETFKDLSENSRDSIKKLLNEAGPQFGMHEPESWPHQAKLASEGKWEELDKYQNYLNNGNK